MRSARAATMAATAVIAAAMIALTGRASADPDPPAPAPLVMAHLGPADAFTADALWEHARDPSVDGIVGAIGYRHQVGDRGWLEGGIGVEAATLGADDGLSLLDATVGAGYRLGAAAVRARVGLPSAADSGSAGGVAAAIAELRVDDRARSRPGTTSLGVYLDWRRDDADDHDAPRWTTQLEAGFEAWVGPGDDVPALRFGAGGGVRVARGAWMLAELTTISFILDPDAHVPGGDFIHALDLGASIAIPRGALAVRLEVPLDEAFRTRNDFAVGLAWRVTP